MKVSKEEVQHVAKLSELKVSSDEIEMFQQELSQILDWQEKMNELDLEGLEPSAHALEMRNVTREDEERPSLTKEKTLQNAPEAEGDYFKVPKIID